MSFVTTVLSLSIVANYIFVAFGLQKSPYAVQRTLQGKKSYTSPSNVHLERRFMTYKRQFYISGSALIFLIHGVLLPATTWSTQGIKIDRANINSTCQQVFQIGKYRADEIVQELAGVAYEVKIATDAGHVDIAKLLRANLQVRFKEAKDAGVDLSAYSQTLEKLDSVDKGEEKAPNRKQNQTSRVNINLMPMQETQKFPKLSGLANAVRYSPDGENVAIITLDKIITIRNIKSGALIVTLNGHTDFISSVEYSPDGLRILTTSFDGTIRIWDAKTGQVLSILSGHSAQVNSAVFSSDGLRILSASSDRTARIWDAISGHEIAAFREYNKQVSIATFSPDGSQVALVYNDHTVRIWNVKSGELMATLLGNHTSTINSIAYSPDGSHIITASDDQTVRLWDSHFGAYITVLGKHDSPVHSAYFSPDGLQIVTASNDGNIRIWDATSGNLVQVLEGHTDWVQSAVFSPDGSQIASASYDKSVRIWARSMGR
jgi:WD40 repeat protein